MGELYVNFSIQRYSGFARGFSIIVRIRSLPASIASEIFDSNVRSQGRDESFVRVNRAYAVISADSRWVSRLSRVRTAI